MNKKIIISCIYAFATMCNAGMYTSPLHSYNHGNIWHSSLGRSHRGNSGNNRNSNTESRIDIVEIKNIDDLLFLDINDIQSCYYQYDYRCENHPYGKPTEFGSDGHGIWYSHIPQLTGYIGGAYCDFQKNIHFICVQTSRVLYKIEYNDSNFNKLETMLNRSKY